MGGSRSALTSSTLSMLNFDTKRTNPLTSRPITAAYRNPHAHLQPNTYNSQSYAAVSDRIHPPPTHPSNASSASFMDSIISGSQKRKLDPRDTSPASKQSPSKRQKRFVAVS